MSRLGIKVYRLGPIVLTPIVWLWGTVWSEIETEENNHWYIILPLLGLAGLAILWHFRLIATEKSRNAGYVGYMIAHLLIFFPIVWFSALVAATHAPM